MLKAFLDEIKIPTNLKLDPHFKPAILFQKKYQKLCNENQCDKLSLVLERSPHNIKSYQFEILKDVKFDEISEAYLAFNLKFILWAVGGYKLYFSGPNRWFNFLNQEFSIKGSHQFDILFMNRVYEKPWIIEKCNEEDLPKDQEATIKLGGNLNGCRIGFDLGASDYKLAALIEGKVVFTTEIRWNPVTQTDPSYHIDKITSGLELAAQHLPRVDAIGGSSAGIIQDNKVRVASLFRSIPELEFEKHISKIFINLQKKWQVPFVVANDGDVSALAGAMSTKDKAILGVAMGSSEAVGYLNQSGEITGQLNELAFAPIDYNPMAAKDEWSKANGVGVMYFSQQAVNRLAIQLGQSFPESMLLPERLKQLQEKMNAGDISVEPIFKTIGTYLGYTLPFYGQYYDINKLMVFGRVVSGLGGDKIIETAKEIIMSEFANETKNISLATPDEEFRRVGQAVAAASLPELR
jgi:predicted NBD/HSP70 family sugar kinase